MTLSLLAGIAPFATDMYLPAFPEMVSDLATTPAGVQLSLTTFLIGAGLGQLIFGPLSDRFGRRRPLIIGMVIYLAASALSALAPTIGVLLTARLFQGLAGAAGMVISRSIITDITTGKRAAQAMSVIMLISGVAPVLAPVSGSILVGPLGWRGLLWIVTVLVAIGLVATVLVIDETHSHTAPAPNAPHASPLSDLTSRAYLGNMLAYVFAFTSMMAYISASPFLYENMMGLSQTEYGLMFGVNAFALMIVGGLSARLARRFRPEALARTGLQLNLCSVIAFVVLVVAAVPRIWLALPILTAVASLGLSFGNTTALALAAVPTSSGLGSAVLGALQHLFSGAIAPIVGIGAGTTAMPLALGMLASSVIANVALATAKSSRPTRSITMDGRGSGAA